MLPNPAFERSSTSAAPRVGLGYSQFRGAPLVPAAQLVRWASQEAVLMSAIPQLDGIQQCAHS
jgi:hypothetical protein